MLMLSDADASLMLVVWCDASSSSCGVGHVKQQAALASPCLFAGWGPRWGGQFVRWQDMPTNCITSGSVATDNRPPYARGRGGGNEWISFMLAPPESPLQQSLLPTLLGPSWHRVRHRQTSPPSASLPPCCPIEEPPLLLRQAESRPWNYILKSWCVCCSGMIADD